MERTFLSSLLPLVILLVMTPVTRAHGDTNSRVVELSCSAKVARTTTVFLPNLIANMDDTWEQVRVIGFGTSTNGSDVP